MTRTPAPPTSTAPHVPLVDPVAQHAPLMDAFREAFERVLSSGAFILGQEVDAFERELADFVGVRHAIGVSSGTDALTLAMLALDIKPRDEVITTPFTWFSSASTIARLGAVPVFVDIHPRTFNIDTRMIEGAITDRTKALLPVHLFGLPANMPEITRIADDHGLPVIADCAQAIGASVDGKSVGSIGKLGCFSFYPTKNLSGLGDGGAVTTNDDELAESVRYLRNHGTRDGVTFERLGGNFRMDALYAALLRLKLPHLPAYNEARKRLAARYHRLLEDTPVITPFEAPERDHTFHQYTIRVRSNVREPLRAHLAAEGIASKVYYPKPMHLQPCFAQLGYEPGQFPEAEAASEQVLSIPIFPEMTRDQQDAVVRAVRDVFDGD
ncbi:MAG: DegT/DnrJ/EryC1/StrS family aminotransferase [Planctomycetota bacterium]